MDNSHCADFVSPNWIPYRRVTDAADSDVMVTNAQPTYTNHQGSLRPFENCLSCMVFDLSGASTGERFPETFSRKSKDGSP